MKAQYYSIGITALAIGLSGLMLLKSPAQNLDPGAGQGGGWPAQRAKERFGLTDAQIGQIKVVLKSERTSIIALLAGMRDARAGLRNAIHSTNASEASVRVASAKVAVVEADAAVERMKLFQRISPILTDEQRTKVAAMQPNLNRFIDQAIQRLDAGLGD